MKKIKKALISVSDKNNLISLLKILKKYKIQLLSSGGTFKEIKKLGFKCLEVSKFTGFPEILNGRVKTLHPKIHAGILSKRNNKSHKKDMKLNKFDEIDLVIVNFYPFEKTLSSTTSHKNIIENIDVGGPTMVRAAAKNYNDVTVITNPDQYLKLIEQLNNNRGCTSLDFRQNMSEMAFSETGYYDFLITNYFNKKSNNKFPKKKLFYGNLIEKLRYGENPHQEGAIYSSNDFLNLKQLNGKKLSYNNYNDIFSALLISKSLPKNTGTVIIKHANPCGVSIDKNKLESFKLALNCDPISAYGGIVSCNFKINKKLALELNKIFLEVIVGNEFETSAIKILSKKKNLRIIDASKINLKNIQNISSNFNSMLIQSSDTKIFKTKDFKIASKIKPNSNTLKNLIFAFNVCRFVKSNAIVIVKNKTTVGIGSGQPSRLDSCKIAINKMKKFQKNEKDEKIIAASDAFFPFVDGIESLVQAGVSAIIQPSGSIRDKEIIKFANKTGTILIFSKTRHFKH
jgi:phosphoribosylaminoimidazolecarboxamide formyltransferase/IMP cyclohydrolase